MLLTKRHNVLVDFAAVLIAAQRIVHDSRCTRHDHVPLHSFSRPFLDIALQNKFLHWVQIDRNLTKSFRQLRIQLRDARSRGLTLLSGPAIMLLIAPS